MIGIRIQTPDDGKILADYQMILPFIESYRQFKPCRLQGLERKEFIMYYITVMQSPRYHQLTLEEYLTGVENKTIVYDNTTANTRTYTCDRIPDRLFDPAGIGNLIRRLEEFNNQWSELHNTEDRHDLYRSFHIPKKSGGLRKIDAPNDKLMAALRELKVIFENDFHVLYHTSAFAYIKHRSTIASVKRHQNNESKWFGKFDLSNFFGSTTPEFVMQQFSMIYPFCEVVQYERGRSALRKALDLAFLDGGLPQGTPISPIITNVMMIPVDYQLSNMFRNFKNQRYVYTRYADDFLVSSKYDFKIMEVQEAIESALSEFGAPFNINRTKTHYGSSSGRNWSLGVMLNKDNEITVGAKNKRMLKAMLTNFVLDTMHGNAWDLNDVQVLEGKRNYYAMVERDTIDEIVKSIGDKFGVNVREMIRQQLRT